MKNIVKSKIDLENFSVQRFFIIFTSRVFPLNVCLLVETQSSSLDWPANWTAAVYIQPKSSLLEHSVEYLSYDPNDLTGDIGGYLGLFLGWSLVTFYDAIPLILTFIRAKTKKK